MKNKIIITLIALLPIAYLVITFSALPDQVVIHWNIHGQADRYGSKLMYVILSLIPIIILSTYGLYLKFSNSIKNQKYLTQLITILTSFFSILALLFISQSTNEQLEITKIMVILFGGLFIIIGNMMNKLQKNFTFGIRIPATLRSEKVWNRVHYIGGYGFVIVGILTLVSSLLITNPTYSLTLMIILMLGLVIYITVYAEILYRRETGHSSLSK